MTQISRYSAKPIASLTVELLPASRALSVRFCTFIRLFSHSWNFNPTALFLSPFFFVVPEIMYFLFFLLPFCHLPVQTVSVNLLHLPDDLLFKDGQDGVIIAHLLEHDAAVELVAHFLEVEPASQKKTNRCSAVASNPDKDTVVSVKHAENRSRLFSPVMALFGKQLLELAQSHNSAFDGCSVWDRLSTEVVSNSHVFTHLALPRLMPLTEQDPRLNTN